MNFSFKNITVPSNYWGCNINSSQVVTDICNNWNDTVINSHDFYVYLILIHLACGVIGNFFNPEIKWFKIDKEIEDYPFYKFTPKIFKRFVKNMFDKYVKDWTIRPIKDIYDISLMVLLFRILGVYAYIKSVGG